MRITRSFRKLLVPVVALLGSAVAAPLMADPLPPNAKPLSSSEVRALYAGKSINWRGPRDGAYFNKNGKVIGVYTDWRNDRDPSKKWSGYYTGTWTTRGNEMCMTFSGYDLPEHKRWSAVRQCWRWYRVGSQYWTIFSKRHPKTRPAGPNDYYTGEFKKFRSGDRISIWYTEYKNKQKN